MTVFKGRIVVLTTYFVGCMTQDESIIAWYQSIIAWYQSLPAGNFDHSNSHLPIT